MRIEAVIEKTHKSLRQTYRTRRNNRTNKDINRLIQQFDNSQDIPRLDHGSTSDEASGDEMVFLARRRASLPSDQSVFFEQNRRRKFMAQFSDQVSTHHTDVFSEEDSAED